MVRDVWDFGIVELTAEEERIREEALRLARERHLRDVNRATAERCAQLEADLAVLPYLCARQAERLDDE